MQLDIHLYIYTYQAWLTPRRRPHLFEPFEVTHAGHGVALHEHVAPREQLQSFQSGTVRPKEALAAVNKLLSIAHDATNLDDVCLHIVLQDFNSLLGRQTSSQQLDQISGFQNHIWIFGLPSSLDTYGAFNQVQFACDAESLRTEQQFPVRWWCRALTDNKAE
jgi:hypothetical protein